MNEWKKQQHVSLSLYTFWLLYPVPKLTHTLLKGSTAVMTYSTYLVWENSSQLQVFLMNTHSTQWKNKNNNEILKSTGEVQSLRKRKKKSFSDRSMSMNSQIQWSLTHEWKYWNSSIRKAGAQKSCHVLTDKSGRRMTYW